jgi:hypothetical protein
VLLALIAARHRSGDTTLVLPSEYLEVVIERLLLRELPRP